MLEVETTDQCGHMATIDDQNGEVKNKAKQSHGYYQM